MSARGQRKPGHFILVGPNPFFIDTPLELAAAKQALRAYDYPVAHIWYWNGSETIETDRIFK